MSENFVKKASLAALARFDSWRSSVMGFGTSRDPLSSYDVHYSGCQPYEKLAEMFEKDDIVARGCEKPPFHMLREGFTVSGIDSEIDEWIESYSEELGLIPSMVEALTWSRLFGGGVIFLGVDDGLLPEEPVNESSIKAVRFINVGDISCVYPVEWEDDLSSKDWGKPVRYHYTAKVEDGSSLSFVVHRSRLLVFDGLPLPKKRRNTNRGWGGSVVDRAFKAIRNFNAVWDGSSARTLSSHGVYKLKGVTEAIAENPEEKAIPVLIKRMEMVDRAKSDVQSLILDAGEEEYEHVEASLSDVPEVMSVHLSRLSTAFDMPVTVLTGKSPDGMNATGESDIRNWYDTLAAEREKLVTPELRTFVRYLLLSKEGITQGIDPEGWAIAYPSFWQLSRREEAEVRHIQAQTDAIYVNAGVLFPEEVAVSRFEGSGDVDEVQLDETLRQARKTFLEKASATISDVSGNFGSLPPRFVGAADDESV